MTKRILILAPYPQGVAASQRFRFEHYFDALKKSGYEVRMEAFLESKTWSILYHSGHYWRKLIGLLGGYWRRFLLLFSLHKFDVLFVHREESPMFFPMLSWYFTHVLKKPLIYDFDDAVWLSNSSESNKKFAFLKSHKDSLRLMKWARINACGNQFLADQAKSKGSEARIIPTVVDTISHHTGMVDHSDSELCIGWTGSHSTMRYLEELRPILAQLKEKISFKFLIISDEVPDWPELDVHFVPWSKENEVKALKQMHIGLMPLPNEEWALGKCGFKLLQYMSVGIVPVAANVGVNPDLLGNGERGILCESASGWFDALFGLSADEGVRQQFAAKCRPYIEANYSVMSNTDNFLLLFADLKP